MCELCVPPLDGTPDRGGPCALDPPPPPPSPVQAAIIGLAGSELHYLPWTAPVPGGPWRLLAGETGRSEGDVPTILRRVGTDEQFGLPRTRDGQRIPPRCGNPSTSAPDRSGVENQAAGYPSKPKCPLSLVDGSPWEHRSDLPIHSPGSPGKHSAPPYSSADGLAAWRLGQGKGSFFSRDPEIFGHLGRKIKRGVGVLSPPKVTSPSV